MYEILFSRKAAKFVSNLPPDSKNKLKEILAALKENPYSYPYKKKRRNKPIQNTHRKIPHPI